MKYIRILGFIIAFGLVYMVAKQSYLYFGRGTVSVAAKPLDASIVIDKKVYQPSTSKDIVLTPGEHKLIIALDGFNTIEQTITMGWQDHQNISYQLTLKSFKDIYQNLSPDPSYTSYSAQQARFFLGNTWAVAYIVDDGEGADSSFAIIRRVKGAWLLVTHDYQLPENAQSLYPPEVYDYIKDFQ